ncbi:MAG: hypothetical protein MJZ12_02465 [Prevotella sp.]|nr:hypothetical protein [Prevotella sp.]
MKRILYIFAMLSLLISCSEKEDTTPSNADKDRLETLIDASIEKIVNFRDSYGTYILYNFDKNLDFAYQFEQASSWTGATLKMIGHDDAEVAVDMLYDKLFGCYSDEFKKKCFPRKLLLVDDIATGSELGLSQPESGHHTAVANINSVTFAKMGKENVFNAIANASVMSANLAEMHRALLADYLVKARGEYPVGEEYFTFSKNTYSSLMDSSRKTASQLVKENPMFFYERGYFIPEDDEATYYPSAEEDLLAYICNMISMDKETADLLYDMPMMANKMHVLTVCLKEMGVDVMKINGNTEQFLLMEYIQPAVIYTNDVVTDNPKATLQVTIMRGSHDLDHLVVSVNGKEYTIVDLTPYTKLRNTFEVELDGLEPGANAIDLALYEKGFDKVAQIYSTGVSYATLDQVQGFTIKCSADTKPDEMSRKIKFEYGSDQSMHPDGKAYERNPMLTTIAFEKHGWMKSWTEEMEGEYRGWKVYKDEETGLVTTIKEMVRDLDENFIPFYKDACSYTFTYNADKELETVVYTPIGGESETIVDNVVYVNGRMMRYNYKGQPYETKYANVGGVSTRVDILDDQMSGKCFGFTATETLNPYYMPEIPAVIPGSVAEIPLQLLYSQYLFNSIDGLWSAGWKKDIKDKTNIAKVTINGATWQYIFKLK